MANSLCCKRCPSFLSYFTANTQITPPSGTSGKLPKDTPLMRDSIERASWPQPDTTATYCLPSSMNDDGGAKVREFVGNSHSAPPDAASNARNIGSLVPPLNTSPPPVASMAPQFGDFAKLWTHAFLPVSTFHACTSLM